MSTVQQPSVVPAGSKKPPHGRPPRLELRSTSGIGKHELVQRQAPASVNRGWQSPRSPRSPNYGFKVDDRETFSVPVIDLCGLSDPIGRLRITNELVYAAREWGCFQLINHGISKELQSDMLRVTKEFFAMTNATKRSFSRAEFHQGFGQSYRTVTGTKNWREVFRHEVAPLIDEEVAQWPNQPEDYASITLDYSKKLTGICEALLQMLSEGLGLNSNYIQKSMGGEVTARLLLNSYPKCAEIEEAYGLPSHTDPNTLTFLTQDEVGGLEAFHDGDWIPVRCLPNSLTVNVSDHLQILSNGRYKSIVHRVLINPKVTRTSIAVFAAPAQDAWLEVAPEIVTEKEPAKYKKITFHGYLGEYYKPGRDQTAVFDQSLKVQTVPKFVYDNKSSNPSPRTPPSSLPSPKRMLVAAN